jgi:hypothetical protein
MPPNAFKTDEEALSIANDTLYGLPGGARTHWKAPPWHGAHVHRTFVAEPLTVLFGSGRTPSKGSGFVRHKPARRRGVNPCLGGELAGRLLQTVFEAVERPIERARQPVVAQRV